MLNEVDLNFICLILTVHIVFISSELGGLSQTIFFFFYIWQLQLLPNVFVFHLITAQAVVPRTL